MEAVRTIETALSRSRMGVRGRNHQGAGELFLGVSRRKFAGMPASFQGWHPRRVVLPSAL